MKIFGPRRALSLIPAVALAAAWTAVTAVPGYAACHSFTVSVNPASVTEGGSTTATVSRDGAMNPSSVQVDTVDETAVAGRDYNAVHQRLSFTTETSQTLQVTTIHNPPHEGSQTFRIQLSSGMGCANPYFVYGPPARVTVLDIDPAPASPSPATSHAPPASPSPATSHAPPPTSSVRPAEAASPLGSVPSSAPSSAAPASSPSEIALAPSPSPSEQALAGGSTGGSSGTGGSRPSGGPPGVLIAAAIVILVIGGGGTFYFLRRRASAAIATPASS